MAEVAIASLKETLCAQQRLLQKLYNELDAEREASSTAASEALSMILRLQEEKAAMKMEAEHYKRLAEEKMCHAEESLAIFEDLMYQKEMEVAALDYQVQAYRCKLLSVGYADPGVGELKFPENLLHRSETLGGEISLEGLRRRNSAPPFTLRFSHAKKSGVEKEISSETNLVAKIVEMEDINDSSSDFEKRTDSYPTGGLNSYFEEIRKLDGRVKEIAGVSYVTLRSSSRSPSPQLSSVSSCDLTKGSVVHEVDKHPTKMLETQITDVACSPSMLDVFEVPSANHSQDTSQSQTKNLEKTILQGEDKFQNPYCGPEGIVESSLKDESDWLKKMIGSSINESILQRPNAAGGIVCNRALIRPASSVSETQPRLNQANQVSEIVEAENQNARQPSKDREEELQLLNEIREQLNLIQTQIINLETKQAGRSDELLSLGILAEEMLHFWL